MLDKSRPYATQFPSGFYEQDYKLFDRDGNEMEPVPEPVTVPDPVPEMEASEARRIDLRLKENAHLRPSSIAKAAREKK